MTIAADRHIANSRDGVSNKREVNIDNSIQKNQTEQIEVAERGYKDGDRDNNGDNKDTTTARRRGNSKLRLK